MEGEVDQHKVVPGNKAHYYYKVDCYKQDIQVAAAAAAAADMATWPQSQEVEKNIALDSSWVVVLQWSANLASLGYEMRLFEVIIAIAKFEYMCF